MLSVEHGHLAWVLERGRLTKREHAAGHGSQQLLFIIGIVKSLTLISAAAIPALVARQLLHHDSLELALMRHFWPLLRLDLVGQVHVRVRVIVVASGNIFAGRPSSHCLSAYVCPYFLKKMEINLLAAVLGVQHWHLELIEG